MPSAVVSSQGAVSALRFGRVAVMGTVVLLILVAGVWGSWGSAQHVMLTKGREHGTIEVTRCAGDSCTGPYTPVSVGSRERDSVVIENNVADFVLGQAKVTDKTLPFDELMAA